VNDIAAASGKCVGCWLDSKMRSSTQGGEGALEGGCFGVWHGAAARRHGAEERHTVTTMAWHSKMATNGTAHGATEGTRMARHLLQTQGGSEQMGFGFDVGVTGGEAGHDATNRW
jgi:hypothetical protein